jgi:hypothetical protein
VGAWVPPSSVPGLLHPMTGPMRAIGALPVASTHPSQASPLFKQQQEELVKRMSALPVERSWAINCCHAAVLKVRGCEGVLCAFCVC